MRKHAASLKEILGAAGKRSARQAIALIKKAQRALSEEKRFREGGLVRLPAPARVAFVGDLHGDFASLKKILVDSLALERLAHEKNFFLVFLGDFVDRARAARDVFRVLETVLELKTHFPARVFLLCGNHEIDQEIISPASASFREDCFECYATRGNDVFAHYMVFFRKLPHALVAGGALAVHGGIPVKRGGAVSLKEIACARIGDDVFQQLVWNDPAGGEETRPNLFRGIGFLWGGKATSEFLGANCLQRVVRSHNPDDAPHGIGFAHGGRVVTVFSSGNYGRVECVGRFLSTDVVERRQKQKSESKKYKNLENAI